MPYASGSHKWKYQMVSARSVRVIGVSFCSGIPCVASCNISNACMHQNLIRSRMILIAPHLNLSGLVFARRFWNKGSPAWIQTFSRKPSDQASVLLQKHAFAPELPLQNALQTSLLPTERIWHNEHIIYKKLLISWSILINEFWLSTKKLGLVYRKCM